MFTSLTPAATPLESTEVGISSLIDTWLLLRDIELGGERNRGSTCSSRAAWRTPTRSASSCITPDGHRAARRLHRPRGRAHRLDARRRRRRARRRTALARAEEHRSAAARARAQRARARGADRGAARRVRGDRGRSARVASSTDATRDAGSPKRATPRASAAARTRPAPKRTPQQGRTRRSDDRRPPPSCGSCGSTWPGQTPKSLAAIAQPEEGLRGAPRRAATRSRWSTCSRTRGSPRTTRSSRSRRWCAGCRRRCARSSATSPNTERTLVGLELLPRTS